MKTHIKRTTVYLDSDLHHALRIKAAETEHSMSELVAEAIKLSLAEDATDLTYEQRKQWAYSNVVFAILADLVNGDNGESVIGRDKRKE